MSQFIKPNIFICGIRRNKIFYASEQIFTIFVVMNDIQWLTDKETPMPAVDKDMLARWIGEVARLHGRITGPLTYIFCDDEKIIEVD